MSKTNIVTPTNHRRLGSATWRLRNALEGHVYLPGESGYDEARLAWNRNIDPQPTVIAEATRPEDVRAAILTAREHDLPFAVQSSGHGVVLPSDGGLLLKTSQMAEVQLDPGQGIVRVGPGALWKDVIAAAAPFGLVPLSGSSSWVGVAGYTLGGGGRAALAQARFRRRQPALRRGHHR